MVDRAALQQELDVALVLADIADAITLPRFEQADFTLGWKNDRTEVTEVDRLSESALAEHVRSIRPQHGFVGEEHGTQGPADATWRWIVDPIDGTSGFVRGLPVWATLIALVHADDDADDVMVSVVSAPALRRRWWAVAGGGAFANGSPCHVSDVDELAAAQVSITFNHGWDELGLTSELVAIQRQARRGRGFGDFWQHCLVAEGALDLAVDAIGVKPYDIAAVRLIVDEAGGRCTDRFGNPSHDAGSAISSNGRLHDEVVARLGHDL